MSQAPADSNSVDGLVARLRPRRAITGMSAVLLPFDASGAIDLNDALQALGAFAFREPVPAYRHDAALFLQLRGWASCARVHPQAPQRPAGESAVLAELGRRLGVLGRRLGVLDA